SANPRADASAAPSYNTATGRAAAQAPALRSVGEFGAALGSPEGPRANAAARSAAYFDGALNATETPDGDGPAVGANAAGRGPNSDLIPADMSDIVRMKPRVVLLVDVFNGPAPETVTQRLAKLIDEGVHVVFLTNRPQTGPGSAQEILLNKLPQGRNNPVIVVSHNGGRIALHGRAANPAPLIDDVDAFPKGHIKAFREITAAAGAALDRELTETGLPAVESAFSYVVTLPKSLNGADLEKARARLISSYNARLRNRNLPYRMEAHRDDPYSIVTHSMPLRFSLHRVLSALDHQFKDDRLLEDPRSFLILADSHASPKFTTSFTDELKGAGVMVVRNPGDVETVLGDVLGDHKLESMQVRLSDVRQWVEFWEPTHRIRPEGARQDYFGGAPSSAPSPKGDQKLKLHFGSVINSLMAWHYEQLYYGSDVSLSQLQAQLESMWYNPIQNRVTISKAMMHFMQTAEWKKSNSGFLKAARAYVNEYWAREFGNPAAYELAAANVRENLAMLGTMAWPKSLITLPLASPTTGRLYKIHTRIPRVMKKFTADGLRLTAYAYRTGKEDVTGGSKIHAKILAMAMLVGLARKGDDGHWHYGSPTGPRISSLVVQFEGRTAHHIDDFHPDDFLTLTEEGQVTQSPMVQDVISIIERMKADAAFQKSLEEHKQEATEADLRAVRAIQRAEKTKKAARRRSR
ncbi:MAG TPA: hypothetical protein VNI01_02850, partial [Elusimicrobiota bacterium]|nr:hypothetical protein [Elusimicrobiota bacterium]